MKNIILLVLILFMISPGIYLYAQDFRKQQQAQQRTIEQAHGKKKITDKEYYKLQAEQQSIADAIAKANADNYVDAKEKMRSIPNYCRQKKDWASTKTTGNSIDNIVIGLFQNVFCRFPYRWLWLLSFS